MSFFFGGVLGEKTEGKGVEHQEAGTSTGKNKCCKRGVTKLLPLGDTLIMVEDKAMRGL